MGHVVQASLCGQVREEASKRQNGLSWIDSIPLPMKMETGLCCSMAHHRVGGVGWRGLPSGNSYRAPYAPVEETGARAPGYVGRPTTSRRARVRCALPLLSLLDRFFVVDW